MASSWKQDEKERRKQRLSEERRAMFQPAALAALFRGAEKRRVAKAASAACAAGQCSCEVDESIERVGS